MEEVLIESKVKAACLKSLSTIFIDKWAAVCHLQLKLLQTIDFAFADQLEMEFVKYIRSAVESV